MAGITKRHCQRLLVAGDVTDAVRTSGGHWLIPDNAEVRKWIAKIKGEKHKRRVVVRSSPVMPNAKIKRVNLPVANEIHKCLENLKTAQAVMQDVIDSTRANAYAAGARLLAAYNENPGGAWFPWLIDNGIDTKEASELMNFAKYCDSGETYSDAVMLKKFDVIKSKPRASGGKVRSFAPQWMTWTGKITGHFSHVKPSQMNDMEKEAMAQQLKPIVDLYKKLSH